QCPHLDGGVRDEGQVREQGPQRLEERRQQIKENPDEEERREPAQPEREPSLLRGQRRVLGAQPTRLRAFAFRGGGARRAFRRALVGGRLRLPIVEGGVLRRHHFRFAPLVVHKNLRLRSFIALVSSARRSACSASSSGRRTRA